MIERIQNGIGNCKPMKKVTEYIGLLKKERKKLDIVEIGVDIGATSVEIIKALGENDTYYFFDFEEKIQELYKDLLKINKNNVKLVPFGNTHKYLDSYSWSLAKLMLEKRAENGTARIFDLVYLDGAHTFIHDGLTICILKEMMKDGGVIILDDMEWSLEGSPTCNPDVYPTILNYYTMEQIETKQVAMAVECFLDIDERFKRIDHYHRIAIYQYTGNEK